MVIPFRAFVAPYAVFAASTLVYPAVCAKCSLLAILVLFVLENSACVQITHHKVENYLSYQGVVDNCSKEISNFQVILNDPIDKHINNSPKGTSGKDSPTLSFFEANVISPIDSKCKMKRTLIQLRMRLRVFQFQLFSLMRTKGSWIISRVYIFFVSHQTLNKMW